MKIIKKILLALLLIFLFFVGISFGYITNNLKSMTKEISSDLNDLGINNESISELDELKALYNINSDEVINIALFGIDSRDTSNSSNSRSDSIIVATIDFKNNKIKLSSIMRDTYVAIDGHSYNKINHAYAYGGAQLAIKTINQNFGLDITDYVTVDFFALEKIINALGGIEVEVKDYEVNEINKFIKEVAKIEGVPPQLLSRSGIQTLTGMQAVSYGRIRKVGNGDYERTDRQRTVIIAMIEKLQNLSLSSVIKLATQCIPYVETSFTLSESIKLGTSVLQGMRDFSVEQKRFPINGNGGIYDGVWYMKCDINAEKWNLLNFIYETDN